MDFKDYLEKTAKELDREVSKILDVEIENIKKIDKKLVPLLEAFKDACMGGKRIRGVLVKLGHQLAGGKSKEIIRIGAAYEIFHGAILAHDDIMDQSQTRRGKPSLYKRVGISEAITLGDLGFFITMKIIPELADIALDTAIGQMLDLKKANPVITAKFKTAKYTIAGPLQLGAIFAGAKGKLIKNLGEFGENLGIAFQMRDDELDGEASRDAKKYINSARKMIPGITKDIKMSKLLEQMGGYLIERTI